MNSVLRVLRQTHNSQFNVRPRLCQRGFQTKQRFHESQVFPYTREQVFDLVADVDRYHEFVPMCTDSRVFRSTANTEQAVSEEPALASPAMIERQSFQAELAVGYPPFRERYMSNVVLERPWRIVATAVPDGGIFTHMRTVWEFAEAMSNSSTGLPTNPFVRKCMGSTRVSFSIEYEFASALHAQAASLVFDKMAQSNLAAYLARCQQLYGK
ncbi:Coenzyme Q-binding protein coq10a, mitochondrial [Coemansia sp. RSA 2610]|nr:Coenzyme Q-binding protein coq10a, mitochondrial [Coemansia sp. RSA 2610]